MDILLSCEDVDTLETIRLAIARATARLAAQKPEWPKQLCLV